MSFYAERMIQILGFSAEVDRECDSYYKDMEKPKYWL
jgi:hypothetical protein